MSTSKMEHIETLERYLKEKANVRDYVLFITLIYCDNKIKDILPLKVNERGKLHSKKSKVNMLITKLIKDQKLSPGDYLFQTQKKGHLKPSYVSELLTRLYETFSFEKMTVLQMRKAVEEAKTHERKLGTK